jgi:SAM-dependent methyltransferase
MSPRLHRDLEALAAQGRFLGRERAGTDGPPGVVDVRPPRERASRSRRLYSRFPFDHASPPEDAGRFERGLSPLARSLPRVLPRTGTVLEVGSGPGHATAWLVRHGLRVVALDQSDACLRTLRARCDAAAVAADVTSLPFADATFAAVLADGVVHHASRPARALREVVRVLAPGGVLFLRVYRAEGRYPAAHRLAGGVLRFLADQPGPDALVWRVAFPAYRRLASAFHRRAGREPGPHDAGVFADYFLTPHATPARGGALVARLRRMGLEILAYERYRNVHGILARRRPGRVA